LDCFRTTYAEVVKPDIIVPMSGDKDFLPVILELRRRGIRVEVAAFPALNAAQEIVLKASGFIDLDTYLHERRPTLATADPWMEPYERNFEEEAPATFGGEFRREQEQGTPA
jgi:hypothetical protein